MNRRQLIAHASAGLGLLLMSGCASGRRARAGGVDPEPVTLPPTHAPTRVSRKPADWDQLMAGQSPAAIAGVIPRSAWTSSQPVMARADRMTGVQRITVHHDGMSPFLSTTQGDAVRRLESIRKAHVGQGWADIGYHYSIDPAGRVYACRPVALQGAHVKDQNPGNIGVMMMGNFEQQQPSVAALSTLESFVASLMRQYRIGTRGVFTHRELASTACPGRNLQTRMVQARASGGKLAFA